jgi:hypothetical protein
MGIEKKMDFTVTKRIKAFSTHKSKVTSSVMPVTHKTDMTSSWGF